MASVTVNIPNSNWAVANSAIGWEPGAGSYVSLGDELSDGGATTLYLQRFRLPRTTSNVFVALGDSQTAGTGTAGPDFSSGFESDGEITVVASNGSSITFGISGDTSDPYFFTPTNLTNLRAFANTLAGLADRSLTVTFDDNQTSAPSFTDNTGDAQNWAVGTAITPIVVPEANGEPAPTYAVHNNSLPAGLQFDTAAREISGTPANAGTGTITIRATNSEGSADWTVNYSITQGAVPVASGYSLLMDTTGIGTYDVNLTGRVLSCFATTGIKPSAGQIEASAGDLKAILTVHAGDDDIRMGYGLRLYWNGIAVWTGTARLPEDVRSGQRITLRITGRGPISNLVGITLNSDVVVDADDTVMSVLAKIIAATDLDAGAITTDVDTQVGAGTIGEEGDDVLAILRRLTLNTDTCLVETAAGGMEIHERELATASGLVFNSAVVPGEPNLISQVHNYSVSRRENMLLANSITIGGETRSDGDSISREGRHFFPDALDFVHADEDAHVAEGLIDIYGDRRRVATPAPLISLMEAQSGLTAAAIFDRLRYGSEYEMHFYDDDEKVLAEPLHTRYEPLRGGRMRVTATLRERGESSAHAFAVNTVINKRVGYSVNLPTHSDDGAREITGHVIEYKLHTATNWTRSPVRNTGNGLQASEIVLPTEDLYDMRIVARSASQDEQVGLQRCILVVNAELLSADVSGVEWRLVLNRLDSAVPVAFRDAFIARDIEWQGRRPPAIHPESTPRLRENTDETISGTTYRNTYGWSSVPGSILTGFFATADEVRVKPVVTGYTTYWSPWMSRADIDTYKHN